MSERSVRSGNDFAARLMRSGLHDAPRPGAAAKVAAGLGLALGGAATSAAASTMGGISANGAATAGASETIAGGVTGAATKLLGAASAAGAAGTAATVTTGGTVFATGTGASTAAALLLMGLAVGAGVGVVAGKATNAVEIGVSGSHRERDPHKLERAIATHESDAPPSPPPLGARPGSRTVEDVRSIPSMGDPVTAPGQKAAPNAGDTSSTRTGLAHPVVSRPQVGGSAAVAKRSPSDAKRTAQPAELADPREAAVPAAPASSIAAPNRASSLTVAEEVAVLDRVQRALGASRPGEALEILKRELPRMQMLSVEAQVFRVEALRRAGRHAEARALGEAFVRRYPNTAHASRVEKHLSEIDPRRPVHEQGGGYEP